MRQVNSIRAKLVAAFLSVVSVLVLLNLVLFVLYTSMVREYRTITDNRILEYRLIGKTADLIQSYNDLVKFVDSDEKLNAYYLLRDEILGIFFQLDGKIASERGQATYIGLKNTISSIIASCDAGVIEITHGNYLNITTHYDDANRKNVYVRQNISDLILYEIEHTNTIFTSIEQTQLLGQLVGIVIMLLVSLVCIYYALSFSKSLILPLARLDSLAKSLVGGNLEIKVDPELLAMNDEIGSLAKSFSIMITTLRGNIVKLRDSNKQLLELNGQLDDQKKNVEQEVQERTRQLSEEHVKLMAAIDSAPYGFALIGSHREILMTNRLFLEILDLPKVSFDILTLNLPSEINLAGAFQLVMDGKKLFFYDNLVYGKKILRLVISPVTLQEDQILGVILTVTDITEGKVTERSKEELFVIASHELKTPLTAIKGNVTLLKDLNSGPNANRHMDEVIDDVVLATNRMIRIVTDFLTTSKLEQGRVEFIYKEVTFDTIVSAVFSELSALASSQSVQLLYTPVPDLLVTVDVEKSKEVLTNLISNALKYTSKGVITVDARRLGNFAEIRVTDTGKGIPIENQKLLFRKFQQAGTSLYARDFSQGTGLGLYISKLIVETMRGEIYLESSEEGKGSTFVFTLPLKKL